MLVFRVSVGLAALVGCVAVVAGCTVRNPSYCRGPADCPQMGTVCASNHACVAAADAGDAGASDGAPDGGGCTDNPSCAGREGTTLCKKSTGTCVECLAPGDCVDPKKPVCDGDACHGCRTDADCPAAPGVCMSHLDGHCATEAETIYVQNGGTCSDTASTKGSSGNPFCTSQLGIDAAISGPGKSLVVMRGSYDLAEWVFAQGGTTITVVGQGNPVIKPGTHVGIRVTAGTVYVRGLRVANGSAVGVVASGGEIHLDRCAIDSNAGGGIQIDGAGFDITNTVVSKNGPGTYNGTTPWGGVFIGSIPLSGVSRFVNNTVVGNLLTGVVCVTAPRTSAGSIFWNNTGGIDATSACALSTCCGGSTVDPMLSADYHLTTASTSCIDKLTAAMSVPDDIDGQLRPVGAGNVSDCGADELIP
jgi:hypothetical protein